MSLALEVGDRGAELSACERYRYSLWRHWDHAKPPVLFVMLNPSTADANADDPTIRKCMKYARRWGAGGIVVVNLYAWRATDPRELMRAAGPVGEFGPYGPGRVAANRNDVAIIDAARVAGRAVCAWGANPGPISHRPEYVRSLLTRHGRVSESRVEALQLTKHGAPRHPLYVRDDVEPVPYPRAVS